VWKNKPDIANPTIDQVFAECSPLTEFYNGTTDLMFFGVGGATDGYLESSTLKTSSLTSISPPWRRETLAARSAT
jgi:hypothetical protein